MSEKQPFYMIPCSQLGLTEDVKPEKIGNQYNDWIALSKDILDKKREAQNSGKWSPNHDISDDHEFLNPLGAEYCPALKEANSMGYLLKWPANAILRKISDKGWQLKTANTSDDFYYYHIMTSFPESGEAQAIAVNTGWMVLTPSGWSTLFKNIPNNFGKSTPGITFAEGVVRTDQANIGLQVHAFIQPWSKDEIRIKRGDPMGIIFPFLRKNLELKILDDEDSIEKAAKEAMKSNQTFKNAKGRYKHLYIANNNPSTFYEELFNHSTPKPKKKKRTS